jgi:hypothetical protein
MVWREGLSRATPKNDNPVIENITLPEMKTFTFLSNMHRPQKISLPNVESFTLRGPQTQYIPEDIALYERLEHVQMVQADNVTLNDAMKLLTHKFVRRLHINASNVRLPEFPPNLTELIVNNSIFSLPQIWPDTLKTIKLYTWNDPHIIMHNGLLRYGIQLSDQRPLMSYNPNLVVELYDGGRLYPSTVTDMFKNNNAIQKFTYTIVGGGMPTSIINARHVHLVGVDTSAALDFRWLVSLNCRRLELTNCKQGGIIRADCVINL